MNPTLYRSIMLLTVPVLLVGCGVAAWSGDWRKAVICANFACANALIFW